MAFRPTTTCDIWLAPSGGFDPETVDPDFTAIPLQSQKALASIGTDQADLWTTVTYLIFRFAIALTTPIPRVGRTVSGTVRAIIGIPDRAGELYEVRDTNRIWESVAVSLQYLYAVPWYPPGPPPGSAPSGIILEDHPLLAVGDDVGPDTPCVAPDATASFFFSASHLDTVVSGIYANLGNWDSLFGSDRGCSMWWVSANVARGDATIYAGDSTGITEIILTVTGEDTAGPVQVGTGDQFGTDCVVSDSFTPTKQYIAIVWVALDAATLVVTPVDWVQVSHYEDIFNNRTYAVYYAHFEAGEAFPGVTFTNASSLNWTYGIMYWTTP